MPRPAKALAVARVFGPEDGPRLLREGWGMIEAAVGLEEEFAHEAAARHEFAKPPTGRPGTAVGGEIADPGERALTRRPAIGTRLTLTVVASGETTGGGALWIGVTDQGGFVAVMPLRTVEGLAMSVG